jgi:ABC-type transport system substrate-binding protein
MLVRTVRWLLVLASLIACRPAAPVGPFDLRVAVFGRLEPVSPKAVVDSWTLVANALVYEPLISLGENGGMEPVLASDVQMIPPKGLRVWLRKDRTFSDGSPLTFDDVMRSLDGTHLRATREQDSILIKSDDVAVPVELQLSFTFIRHSVGGKDLGTGAFALAEQDSEHIILRRRIPSPGHVESLSIISYKTPKEAFAHTLKGDAELLPQIEPRWVEFVEGVPGLRVLRIPSPYAAMVAFNPTRFSAGERSALVELFRNDELRRLAFGDDCIAPVAASAASGETVPRVMPRRKLDVLAFSGLDRFALAVRRVLSTRGGEVQVRDQTEFLTDLKDGNFDLATGRERISPPIMAVRNWHTGAENNVSGYSNPQVDAALDAHDWIGAQRALDADPPAAVICKPVAVGVMDARITNVSTTRFWASVAQWEVHR